MEPQRFNLERIRTALERQDQDWEHARAALAELGRDLQFRISSALRDELDAALSPKLTTPPNPLGTLGVRA